MLSFLLWKINTAFIMLSTWRHNMTVSKGTTKECKWFFPNWPEECNLFFSFQHIKYLQIPQARVRCQTARCQVKRTPREFDDMRTHKPFHANLPGRKCSINRAKSTAVPFCTSTQTSKQLKYPKWAKLTWIATTAARRVLTQRSCKRTTTSRRNWRRTFSGSRWIIHFQLQTTPFVHAHAS